MTSRAPFPVLCPSPVDTGPSDPSKSSGLIVPLQVYGSPFETIHFVAMGVLLACVPVHRVTYLVPKEAGRGCWIPWNFRETPRGPWESNSGPLEQWPELLTAEPSPPPCL